MSEIDGKLKILQAHYDEHGDSHSVLKGAVEWEVTEGAVRTKKPSASRTLLRLHRAMEFILAFVKAIAASGPDDKPSSLCSKAYASTLSHHHAWLVRKAVGVAFMAFPNRSSLLTTWLGSGGGVSGTTSNGESSSSSSAAAAAAISWNMAPIHDLIDSMEKIYSSVDTLLTSRDLLDIP